MPFVISAHVHPQVPATPMQVPAATGIDYLGLVLAASEDAIPGAIRYRQLGDDADAEEPGGRP